MFGEAPRDALCLGHLLQASGAFLFVVTAPPAERHGEHLRATVLAATCGEHWRRVRAASSNSLVSVAIARRVDYGKAEESSCCYRV